MSRKKMDDDLYEFVVKQMHDIVYRPERTADNQKLIDLAILKRNLRDGLENFERDIRSLSPGEKKKTLAKYNIVKDTLWQVVGAMHGNMTTSARSAVGTLVDLLQ